MGSSYLTSSSFALQEYSNGLSTLPMKTGKTLSDTKAKETWDTPKITELDVRLTESNIGDGADGGPPSLSAS